MSQPFTGTVFECPSCGASVVVTEVPTPMLFHPYPTCERFKAVDTVADGAAYMREAREKGEN